MKSKIEEFRLVLSRLAALVVLFFLCTTQSYWEAVNEALTLALFFIGMVLVAIASLGRMWCSLFIAGYKDKKLITEGPYSLCRNPLYFFSAIGVVGIGCATETFIYPIIFIILFLVYYPFVIKSEEKHLRQLFETEFDEYKKRVPAFFPKLSTFSEPGNYHVKPAVYRRHIFCALWFIWIVGILEVIEGLVEIGIIIPLWSLY